MKRPDPTSKLHLARRSAKALSQSVPKVPIYVYRGVHADHPLLEYARNGEVVPGRLDGKISESQHNDGGWENRSQFTSWSYSYDVAHDYAVQNGPGFVILRIDMNEAPEGSSWSWVRSPDRFDEQEILLRGTRIGVEVFVNGRSSSDSA